MATRATSEQLLQFTERASQSYQLRDVGHGVEALGTLASTFVSHQLSIMR